MRVWPASQHRDRYRVHDGGGSSLFAFYDPNSPRYDENHSNLGEAEPEPPCAEAQSTAVHGVPPMVYALPRHHHTHFNSSAKRIPFSHVFSSSMHFLQTIRRKKKHSSKRNIFLKSSAVCLHKNNNIQNSERAVGVQHTLLERRARIH